MSRPAGAILGLLVLAAAVSGLAGLGLGASRLRPTPTSGTASDRAKVDSSYGQLPLAFAPNRGEFQGGAAYVARGEGYTLWLTRRGAVLGLKGRGDREAAVSISLLGANPQALAASSQLPGVVNYLIGSDRSSWRTGIPTYGRVIYRDAWPGISSIFYGTQGRLEYDFEVAAGADPGRIGLSLAGARGLRAERSGGVVIGLPGGSVRQLVPHAYQRVDGLQRAVASHYVVSGHTVRLSLGAYDRRLPLTIDPALVYSTYLGGSDLDAGNGIAVDSTGAAYVTGETWSLDFPTTIGAFQPTNHGGAGGDNGFTGGDGFVTKLSPDGRHLVYSTYLGGSGADQATGIAVDRAGDAYVVGYTESSDFPTTSGAFQPTYNGGGDAFVTKLSPDGSQLVYSTYLGGARQDGAAGVAVDSAGDAYVTGFTSSTDFPTTPHAFQPNHAFQAPAADRDAFVTKLAPDGRRLLYSTFLGGASRDEARGIAVDRRGDAYVTGWTQSGDFPITRGAFRRRGAGFVTKLAPNGRHLVYSTYFVVVGEAIAVDSRGAAYITGGVSSYPFPTTRGAYQRRFKNDAGDAFVTEFAPSGKSLVYSTLIGGSHSEAAYAIAVDSAGAAYITGVTYSYHYPTTRGALQRRRVTSGGEGFLTKFAPSGKRLLYSTYLPNTDQGSAIAVDSTGAGYVTGYTNYSDLPTTPGAAQPMYGGGEDAFVMKLATPPFPLKLSVSPRSTRAGKGTCFDFKATSDGLGVFRARIDFARRTKRTSQSGAATICLALRQGTYRPRASKPGYRTAHTSVRVRR